METIQINIIINKNNDIERADTVDYGTFFKCIYFMHQNLTVYGKLIYICLETNEYWIEKYFFYKECKLGKLGIYISFWNPKNSK